MTKLKHILVLTTALTWLALNPFAHADGLPMAKPEEVGLSSERLAHLTQTLRADIGKGQIPGAALVIARHGKIAYFESLGALDPQTKTPMTKDAIFRIYSMSKPITTVAAMTLFEDGRFNLDEPIGKYLQQLAKAQVAVDNKPDPEADHRQAHSGPGQSPDLDPGSDAVYFGTHL